MSDFMMSLLAGVALKSTAVLGLAWIAALLMRRQSAAARHIVWTAAFVAVLAMPVLSLSLPALRVRVASAFVLPNIVFQASVTGSNQSEAVTHTRQRLQLDQSASVPRSNWGTWIILLWAAGAFAGLTHMFVGWLQIRSVRRRATTATIAGLPAMTALAGVSDNVEVLETETGTMPMTVGLLRPAILLPGDAATWTEERSRVVLLHELAHVRRGDAPLHLIARFALNLYWWNPLAWTAWRAFLNERERAADDLVLASGSRASDYAGHLLDIARTMQVPASFGSAAITMARRSQLEGRLIAILNTDLNRSAPGRAAVCFSAALALVIVAPFAALRAQESTPASAADVRFRSKAADGGQTAEKHLAAENLLRATLAKRAQASGRQGVEYGVTLVELGEVLQKERRTVEADALYEQAVSVLGNRPEAARAMTHLGISALAAKEFDRAYDQFQRASLLNSAGAGIATMWMAVARHRAGNFEEADGLYRQALVIQDPSSSEAATTMQLYSMFLGQQGRSDEARSLQDGALAVRKSRRERAMAAGQETNSAAYRIGNGVTAPVLIAKMEPEYTDEARVAQLQGTAVLYAEIGPDGETHNVQIISGLGLGLDEKAVEAINAWKFRPGTKDGEAVTVRATIEVNFRLL